MNVLDNTRACAEHQEKTRGSSDWCAIRISGAELGQWNGDYIVKNFEATYKTCPYYERKEFESFDDDDLDPGIGHHEEYDIEPPHLTGGKGWCMSHCPKTSYSYWSRTYYRCRSEDRRQVYCAPVCDSSSCCLPSSGWQRIESTGGESGFASTLRISSGEHFENHLPPLPPQPPMPPQQPPTLERGTPTFNYVGAVAAPIYVLIALGIIIGFRRHANRLRRLAQAAAERQQKLWSDEKHAMELAIRALPTRRFVSSAEVCEDGAGVAAGKDAGPSSSSGLTNDECAVCLESFAVGDEIRSLPCKHEFHVRRP